MTTTPPTRRRNIVVASVGSIFAQVHDDDRVVAIEADTAFGGWRPESIAWMCRPAVRIRTPAVAVSTAKEVV
jgi:hypothetical protein